jgi:site-specific DNA recombinase
MQAGVYLRESIDVRKDELAVSRQREILHALCQARGWDVGPEYQDNDVSASKSRDAAEFMHMVRDARAGRFDVLVANAADRVARRLSDLEYLVDLGIKVVTAQGDINLLTPEGEFQGNILVSFARMEVRQKSKRQKDAALQRAQQGRPQPGVRAFGYAVGGLELLPGEAQALRQAYQSLLAGSSLTSIARELNAQGLRSSKGNVITRNAVRAMLLNPRNAGQSAYRGEVVGEATWDGIVDLDTYLTAKAILTDDHRLANHTNARKHLLTNLAVCGICNDGTKMVANYRQNRSGSRSRIYVCPKFHLSREASFCDERVVQRVIARLSRPDAWDLLVDQARPDVEVLRTEQHTLRLRLDQLVEDFADGRIAASQLHKGTERLRVRLADLDKAMAHIDRGPLLEDLVTANDVYAVWQGKPLDQQRAIIDTLYRVTLLPRPGGRPPAGDPLENPALLATVRMEPKICLRWP